MRQYLAFLAQDGGLRQVVLLDGSWLSVLQMGVCLAAWHCLELRTQPSSGRECDRSRGFAFTQAILLAKSFATKSLWLASMG